MSIPQIDSRGLSRRNVLAAIGAGGASTLPGIALAQPTTKWSPSSPIKMVVPYAVGGGTDVLARPGIYSDWRRPGTADHYREPPGCERHCGNQSCLWFPA